MKKNMYFSSNFFALVLVLLLAGNYVFGWGLPTAVPPGGDLPAPLDMSSTSQTKTGNLTIDSLLKIGRYTSAPTGSTGSLYYDTTENEFKGYKTSGWDSLGGGGVDTWITTQTCSTDHALQSVGKESKVCINKVDYSDVAYDLSCEDCIGPTEITDSYILNTSDAMSGNLTVAGNVGIGTTSPGAKLAVMSGNTLLNGVGIWSRSRVVVGTDTFSYDLWWGPCLPLKIWAACSHWTAGYEALLETTIVGDSYMAFSQWNQLNISTANSGGWTLSRPSNATLKITKTAGTYAGILNCYITIMSPTAFITNNP